MKKIEFLLIVSFLFFGLSGFANDEKFETHKAEALKRIEERMAKLTEHRSCVSGSTSRDQLKACREKMRDWLKEQKEERMERREERKEKSKSKS